MGRRISTIREDKRALLTRTRNFQGSMKEGKDEKVGDERGSWKDGGKEIVECLRVTRNRGLELSPRGPLGGDRDL